MKLKRIFGSIAFLITTFLISHAQTENHQVFIGQIGNDEDAQNIFTIDFMDTPTNDHIYIDANGKTWISADRLVKITNEALEISNDYIQGTSPALINPGIFLANLTNITNVIEDQGNIEERRFCPNCRHYWIAGREITLVRDVILSKKPDRIYYKHKNL